MMVVATLMIMAEESIFETTLQIQQQCSVGFPLGSTGSCANLKGWGKKKKKKKVLEKAVICHQSNCPWAEPECRAIWNRIFDIIYIFLC